MVVGENDPLVGVVQDEHDDRDGGQAPGGRHAEPDHGSRVNHHTFGQPIEVLLSSMERNYNSALPTK